MFNKKTVKDFDVRGKKVLVRVDFNVPIKDGMVSDDTRIKAALPTINYLIENGAAVILTSHLGRPGGKRNLDYSLQPVAEYLDKLIEAKVQFAPDCIGETAREAVEQLNQGEVVVLENTRFHPGEKKNDPEMGKELASFANIFVNDAFGTAHRAHASNVGVADHLPAAAGFLLEKEIVYLGNILSNPDRPFTAILGGAKVSGKIGVINHLIQSVDKILIGGGMANTFFAAKGYDMADSLVEQDAIDLAGQLLEKAGEKLILPTDLVIGDQFSNHAAKLSQDVGDVEKGWMVMDIGDKTIEKYGKIVKESKTVVWNGPMGVFEFSNFAEGTFSLAKMLAESDAITIIGGGDSAAAIVQSGLSDQITHISTGGGASLQMLEGEALPGLEALTEKYS